MDLVKYNVENKIFAYNVIRMEEEEEEEETFWYHCGRLVKAIRLYYEEKEYKKEKISDICIFLHKHCMKNGGIYANKGRMIGNHIAIDPAYIFSYMNHLNIFYEKNKHDVNIAILIYYNFITIHPFSDGNGRVAKTLIFILYGLCKCISFKKQHKNLCKELGRLQRSHDSMFDITLNVNFLKNMLK